MQSFCWLSAEFVDSRPRISELRVRISVKIMYRWHVFLDRDQLGQAWVSCFFTFYHFAKFISSNLSAYRFSITIWSWLRRSQRCEILQVISANLTRLSCSPPAYPSECICIWHTYFGKSFNMSLWSLRHVLRQVKIRFSISHVQSATSSGALCLFFQYSIVELTPYNILVIHVMEFHRDLVGVQGVRWEW